MVGRLLLTKVFFSLLITALSDFLRAFFFVFPFAFTAVFLPCGFPISIDFDFWWLLFSPVFFSSPPYLL